MKLHLSKRNMIRITSFLTALVVVLGIGTGVSIWRSNQYKRQLENTYIRALQELSTTMTTISNTLNKGIYAGTPAQLSELSSQLWREAGSAKTSLTSLPITALDLTNTYKFLSQVGDYAMTVGKNSTTAGSISAEDSENLASLLEYAKMLNEHINNLEYQMRRGEIDMDDIIRAGENPGDTGADTQQSADDTGTGNDQQLLLFKEMEESSISYPTLIYDGPFSDHLVDRKPLLLENLANVTEAEARHYAAEVMRVDINAVDYDGDENSNMAAFMFSAGDISVGITKQGGLLAYLSDGRAIGEKTIAVEDTIAIAREYLETKLGLTNMRESYYEAANGVCTVNFAYMEGEVVCYTDLVKVGVALDNGDVVFVDTRGYISNHKARSLEAPGLSTEEAQRSVNGNLTVVSTGLALIPTAGQYEVLTYEFKCENANGEHVLVYVDVNTGAERQILLLIETEDGVLTM